MNEHLIILAGNYQEYKRFLELHHLDRRKAHYLNETWKLCGFHGDIRIVKIGTWILIA